MTETEKLIERLEKATGPDRELDAAIWVATTEGVRLTKNSFGGTLVEQHGVAWRLDEAVHHFTASLDAALALVERGRPECRPTLWKNHSREWGVNFEPGGADTAYASSHALALCLALLRTLETSHD